MAKTRFRASISGGALFKAEARADFLSVTSSAFGSMKARLKKKKLPPPPFTLEQLRADLLGVMGGRKDGVIFCRYCKGPFTVAQVALDHADPLSRGGALGLENIDYPCRPCNDRKGSLTIAEYEALLKFLDTIPLGRADVLKRLQQSTKLAAQARFNIARAKAGQAAAAVRGPRSLPLLEEEF